MNILKALLPTLFEVSLHSECEMKHSAESTIEAVSASSVLFKTVSEFDQPDFTPKYVSIYLITLYIQHSTLMGPFWWTKNEKKNFEKRNLVKDFVTVFVLRRKTQEQCSSPKSRKYFDIFLIQIA